MGRGCGWSSNELESLARSWVHATEDPVTGIDQTAGRFRETMFAKFKTFAPPDSSDKTYGGRTSKSVRAKFDELAADIQKFREALRRVGVSNPSGVTRDEILSMAIAIHLGHRDTMSYDARSYPHSEWKNHLAYKVLMNHPKFSDEGSVSSAEVGQSTTGVDISNPSSHCGDVEVAVREYIDTNEFTDKEPAGNLASREGGQVSTDAIADNVENTRRPCGRKSEIRLRATDKQRSQSIENGRLIAESLQRRNQLAEEKTALMAYSREECETPEDLRDRAEYLRLLRKDRLRALRERISGTERGTPRPRMSEDTESAPSTLDDVHQSES